MSFVKFKPLTEEEEKENNNLKNIAESTLESNKNANVMISSDSPKIHVDAALGNKMDENKDLELNDNPEDNVKDVEEKMEIENNSETLDKDNEESSLTSIDKPDDKLVVESIDKTHDEQLVESVDENDQLTVESIDKTHDKTDVEADDKIGESTTESTEKAIDEKGVKTVNKTEEPNAESIENDNDDNDNYEDNEEGNEKTEDGVSEVDPETDSKSEGTLLDDDQMDEVSTLEEEPEDEEENHPEILKAPPNILPLLDLRPKRVIKPKEDDQFITGDVKIKEERTSDDEANLEFEIDESPRVRGGHSRGRGRGRRKAGRRIPNQGFREPDGVNTEMIQKPFLLGWKREVVIRNQGGDDVDLSTKSKKQMADVYYFSPKGKKLRSMVEISDYLHKTGSELQIQSFTFTRKPVYREPEETVRFAGRHLRTASGASPRGGVVQRGVSPRGRGRGAGRPPKIRSPAVHTTTSASMTTTPMSIQSDGIVVKKRTPGRPPKYRPEEEKMEEEEEDVVRIEGEGSLFPEPSNSFHIEIVNDDNDDNDNASKEEDALKKEDKENVKTIVVENKKRAAPHMPAREKPGPKRFKKFYHEEPVVEAEESTSPPVEEPEIKVCGMDCAGLKGVPPSLCCDICMCMFHPLCVNFNRELQKKFRCKKCDRFTTKKPQSGASAVTMKPSNPVPVSLTANRSMQYSSASEQPIKIPNVISHSNSGVRTPILIQASNNRSLLIGSQYNPAPQGAPQVPPVSLLRTSAPAVIVPPNQVPRMVIQRPPLPMVSQYQSIPQGGAVVTQQARHPVTSQPRTIMPPGIQNQMAPTQSINQGNQSGKQMSGQLLTLPPNVLKRLNMHQPLAIKLNGKTLVVSPTCFIPTADGMKVFLPPDTLPSDSIKATDISISQGQENLVSSGKPVNASPTKVFMNTAHQANSKSPPAIGSISSVVPSGVPPTTSFSNSTSSSEKKVTPTANSEQAPPRPRPGPRSKTRVPTYNTRSSVCHFQQMHRAYDCMFTIFEYLNVADRLRAGQVCKTWRNLAANNLFWRTVSLKNVRVSDWESAVKTLNRFGTEKLDMCGLLHFEDKNRTWHHFTAVLSKLRTVSELVLGQCPVSILYVVAERLPDLTVLSAEWITESSADPALWNTSAKIDLAKLAVVKNLQELRLRGVCGLSIPAFSFSGGPGELGSLSHLRQLSLTTLKDVPSSEFSFLADLENLQELEIGEIQTWTAETYSFLGKLTNLRHLRLEHGGELNDPGLADALLKLKKLLSLELIMIRVSSSLQGALSQMPQLKSLSVWPDVQEQSAAVNSNTLNALITMKSLKTLDWGITADEQTSIILNDDDNDQSDKKRDNVDKKLECIPFYASITENGGQGDEEKLTDSQRNVEYISISSLVDKLHGFLTETKIRVFRVPVANANVVSKAI